MVNMIVVVRAATLEYYFGFDNVVRVPLLITKDVTSMNKLKRILQSLTFIALVWITNTAYETVTKKQSLVIYLLRIFKIKGLSLKVLVY